MENVLNKNKTQHKEFINYKSKGQRDNGHGSNNDLEKSGTVAVINILDVMRWWQAGEQSQKPSE